MEINDVLFLDCETTGLPERTASWDKDYMDYPHIVQLAWIIGDKEESHIIIPDGYKIPDDVVEVHGITTEMAMENGEPLSVVIDKFISDCLNAGLLCGHNIHFDTSIIKANILRSLGHEYFESFKVDSALYKGKRIDTMRPAMKWVDARTSNGRLKFPKLEELYSRCFPGQTFPAHNALEDCKAVKACLPTLISEGLIELKVKEYDNNPPMKPETGHICSINEANSANDKCTEPQKKIDFGANSAKITEMLNQNDF